MDATDQIDRLITSRAKGREAANAEAHHWRISERALRERKREDNRIAWLDYHQGQVVRLRTTLEALVSKHEQAAERLMETLERGEA